MSEEYCYITPEEAPAIERILWAVLVMVWGAIGAAGLAVLAFAVEWLMR